MQQGRRVAGIRIWHWLLAGLLVWVGCAALNLAHASGGLPDHVSSRGYLLDETGEMSLQEAQQWPFRPMPPVLALGHTSAVVWLRVDVEPMAAHDLVLTLEPHNLEDVRVFLPDWGGWRQVNLGTQVPYADRGRSEGHIAVALPDRTRPDNLRVYVRIESAQHLVLKVQVLHAPESLQRDMQRSLLVSFGIGLLLTLAVLSLLHWVTSRDRQWLIAAAGMVFALVLVAGTAGLLDKYVFQEQPQLSGYLKDTANIGYMALMYWYFLRLFRLYRAPGWTVWPNRLYLTLAPLLLLAVWLGYAREA